MSSTLKKSCYIYYDEIKKKKRKKKPKKYVKN